MDSSPDPAVNESWWKSFRAALAYAFQPLRGYDAAELEAIERERCDANFRRVQLIAPFTLLLGLFVQWRIRSLPAPFPSEASFRNGLLLVASFGLPVSAWNTFVTLHPWGKYFPWYRKHIGEFTWMTYLLLGAGLSANAQQAHGSISAFLSGLLLGSTVFRVHLPTLLFGLLSAYGVLLAGILALQENATLRAGLPTQTLQMTVIGFVVARTSLGAMASEIVARVGLEKARKELEQVNSGLEQRVAEQTKSLREHAEEVEALNAQLDQQVRERSRELSEALSKLAKSSDFLKEFSPGELLAGRVELRRRIAEGGMGVVLLGYDRVAKTEVAVKVLHPAFAREIDELKRFLREGEVLASVRHPGIVRTRFVGVSEEGRFFLVLEYVRGLPLQTWMNTEEKLPQASIARLVARIAEALAAAHAAGIVHRDVKPSNVMLTGSEPGVKLLDFGIARSARLDAQDSTRTGDLLGTPAYMAPEQLSDPRNVKPAADLYALGAILYTALLGKNAFGARTSHEFIIKHAQQDHPLPHTLDETIDQELSLLVGSCLNKNPDLRPTAPAAAAQLDAIANRLGAPSAIATATEILIQRGHAYRSQTLNATNPTPPIEERQTVP